MTSQIDICNLALAAINARSSISSLTEGSTEANALNLAYMPILREALRAANWNFAEAQVALALLGSADTNNCPVPWLYKYAYPTDCIRMRYLIPSNYRNFQQSSVVTQQWLRDNPIFFKEVSDLDLSDNRRKVIVTNEPQVIGVYTTLITDTGVFDDDFVLVFSNMLAARIASPLSGSDKNVAKAIALADKKIAEARVNDGNEGITFQDTVPDWIRIRGYCSDYQPPFTGNFIN